MDQTITCCDCNEPFTFTDGERGFYKSKNLTPPRRCQNCRALKKAKREGFKGDPMREPQSPDVNTGMGFNDGEL